ncbi:MAG: rhomboid family intramembrane serine protease [Bryobacteraceae bacterium]|nr:rhomboid family intramembrane serine protease [Bryobacteraceae bacterium]
MPFTERSYLRGNSGSFPQGLKWLLIANVAIYLLYFLLSHAGFGEAFEPFFLRPIDVASRFMIWQVGTYMFFHDVGAFGHILFNMLALWMFGSDIERAWGTRRFLQYYFLCGVGAAVCVVIANLLFGNPFSRTIGASGAIFGLLLAFGMLFPERQVMFSFLFPIKAKYFVMILGAIELLSSYASIGGPVSNVAHLGGMAIGYFYIRAQRRKSPLSRPATSFWGNVRGQYEEWKIQRARRKFQVYLKKRQDHDPYVH